MAIEIGGISGNFDESGYLSDESDFYGDEEAKHEFESRAKRFNVLDWWENKRLYPSPTELAEVNLKNAVTKKTATLYNPYEGDPCGRQLGETVDEFMQRLPPRTTAGSNSIPWIFIANPYRKAPKSEDSQQGIKGEGPPDEESDWAKFVVLGGNLLEELTEIRHAIEKKKPGQAKASITRALNPEKDTIVKRILKAAKDFHCTSGKWMIFCEPLEVNEVWSVVARATAQNDLGIAAKVAPLEGEPEKSRLICIYTKDFTDMEDVSRVVRKMRDLGLVDMRTPIYYKCDGYTYLGLNSKNEYNIKASLYSSADVLKPKEQQKDQKLKGYFYKQKKDHGDWRKAEWE